MDTRIARDIVEVIRAEREKRIDRLADEDPDYAHDQWLFADEPFINDMCLMVLVALRHQVERRLVSLAARAGSEQAMTREEYWRKVGEQRKKVKNRG